MIEVKNLTQWYGRTLAVDTISFNVSTGSVVGTITAENSESHPETYIPNTQPNQQMPMSFGPFIGFDSFSDSVSPNWAEVTSWKDSGPTDFH